MGDTSDVPRAGTLGAVERSVSVPQRGKTLPMAQQRTSKSKSRPLGPPRPEKDKSRPKDKGRPKSKGQQRSRKKKSRFRLGMLLGSAVGYVLGAKAGRARYEQIQSWARRLGRSEPAQQLSDEARMAASRAGEALEHKASESVSRITDRVRPNGGDSDPVTP